MNRILTLGFALALGGLLAHCSQDSKSGDQSPAPAPPRPVQPAPILG